MCGSAFQGELSNRNSGTTVQGIRQKELMKCSILAPSLDVQKKIANILFSIERKIGIISRIKDNLLARINSMFSFWINEHSDEITDCNDATCWHYGSIYEFSKITYGAPFSSSMFNSESKGLPLIRIRDLKTNSPQFFTEENHPKKTEINAGDILIGMDAEFRPYQWLGEKGLLNQRVCKLESVRKDVCDYLAMLLIRSELEFVESYKTGTTVAHIGKEDFDNMVVVIPSMNDIIQFSIQITPMCKMMVTLGKECRRLAQIRDILLPKLMSGEIDVSALEIPSYPVKQWM